MMPTGNPFTRPFERRHHRAIVLPMDEFRGRLEGDAQRRLPHRDPLVDSTIVEKTADEGRQHREVEAVPVSAFPRLFRDGFIGLHPVPREVGPSQRVQDDLTLVILQFTGIRALDPFPERG